jgi:hypothetical protein
MIVKVRTKSNYKNLNNTWLDVVECRGDRVSCIVIDLDGREITSDFTLSEIIEIEWSNKKKSS